MGGVLIIIIDSGGETLEKPRQPTRDYTIEPNRINFVCMIKVYSTYTQCSSELFSTYNTVIFEEFVGEVF